MQHRSELIIGPFSCMLQIEVFSFFPRPLLNLSRVALIGIASFTNESDLLVLGMAKMAVMHQKRSSAE